MDIDYITSSDELAELYENMRIESLENMATVQGVVELEDSYQIILDGGESAYLVKSILTKDIPEKMKYYGIPKELLHEKKSERGAKYYKLDKWEVLKHY